MLWVDFVNTPCEIAPGCIPQASFDERSTLLQVMESCCSVTNQCPGQCWRRSISPYGVIRSQLVRIYESEILACMEFGYIMWLNRQLSNCVNQDCPILNWRLEKNENTISFMLRHVRWKQGPYHPYPSPLHQQLGRHLLSTKHALCNKGEFEISTPFQFK